MFYILHIFKYITYICCKLLQLLFNADRCLGYSVGKWCNWVLAIKCDRINHSIIDILSV